MTDEPQRPARNPASSGPSLHRCLRRSATAAAVVAVAAVLYGTNGFDSKKAAAAGDAAADCSAAKALSAKLAPLAHGEVAAFEVDKDPKPMPQLPLSDADGKKQSLADMKGKTLLVNFWATWCVPCRKEMPSLDKLQTQMGGRQFEVVAVNTDTARLEKAKAFYADTGIKSLAYHQGAADVLSTMKSAGVVMGLPTTVLLDGQGCQLGKLAGGASWSSPDAMALMKAALGQ